VKNKLKHFIVGKFQSSKVFDGYSTVFRQHKAEGTHCKYLHGYGISFKVYFEGDIDERNWVWDFGGMKRAKGEIDGKQPKEWMDFMFDHTMIIAEDDPFLEPFKKMNDAGVAQIRILPATGAEKFAEYIYSKLNPWVESDSNGRVKITQVEVKEHDKNSALYIPTF
jgi:6-pyruvoyltetrahydropterin/6-carboxytetrahydropterin synthase